MKITQSAIQSEGSSQSWQSASNTATISTNVASATPNAPLATTSAVISTAGMTALLEETSNTGLVSQSTVVQADGSTQTTATASTTDEASIVKTSATTGTVQSGTTAGGTLAGVAVWQSNTSHAIGSSAITNPRLLLLIAILEALTRRKVHLYDGSTLLQTPATSTPSGNTAGTPAVTMPSWSIHIATSQVHEEAQSASYRSSGQVTTADGRQISFSLDLGMQRYERQESTSTLDLGSAPKMKDPLVLNLATDSVRLQADTFSFDLNADGTRENISRLAGGSAFLALDRNGNGQIDNGSELFGATSGDGFADLAKLDDDHNGWIDENDAAFSQLQVWRPGEQAQSLKDAGVGAIALDHAATAYTLKTDGATTGAIRSTGMFLMEDGQTRTAQQIDMAV